MGPRRKDTEVSGVSLRNNLAERARPYLQPGEQIQAVFKAQSDSWRVWQILIAVLVAFISTATLVVFFLHDGQLALAAVWVVALSIMFSVFFRVHHVVVTDRAIVVLDVSKWTDRPTRLRLRHPRDFYFGQLSGLRGSFVLDNAEYWVHRRFHKDVAPQMPR
jgi:hypothetical protein